GERQSWLPRAVLRRDGFGHARKGPRRSLAGRSSDRGLRRDSSRVSFDPENVVASRYSSVRRDLTAMVLCGPDAQSRVLPCLHSRTQSGAVLQRSLPPPGTVLVLHSSHGAGLDSLDSVCVCSPDPNRTCLVVRATICGGRRVGPRIPI